MHVTSTFTGRSRSSKSFLHTIGLNRAVTPTIASVLNRLLPITFPIAISLLPLRAETELTTNSGSEVPNDTMVSPIKRVDTLNFRAIDEAPSVRKSAPLMTKSNPMINLMMNNHISFCFDPKLWCKVTKYSVHEERIAHLLPYSLS